MTICPIAVVAGCQKCPAFSLCPLKTVLGDQKGGPAGAEPKSDAAAAGKDAPARRKKS